MVFMPHWPIPHYSFPRRVDLAVMNDLLSKLGDPQLKLPPVIHVAGTNGKGSTVAYLRSILSAAGYKVHAYTSPHLLEFNERIVVSGSDILDDYLFHVLERTRRAAQTNNIDNTFFEGTTAAAFLAFAENPADVVLLETGMGGRLDATTAVPHPILSIITPISYDHMQHLGPTLPIIAGEKAGIIKRNIPCVISAQIPEVMEVFFSRCEEMNSRAIAYGYDFAVDRVDEEYFAFMCPEIESRVFKNPTLPGDHQILNSGVVIAALENIKQHFTVTDRDINMGLKNVNWPGRLQKVHYKQRELWLDAAHNTGGAQVLALWVKEHLTRPVALILGMTKNRDAMDFVRHFYGIVDKIICVQVMSEPSSYKAEILEGLIKGSGIETETAESLDEALGRAGEHSGDVIISGSTFLVADILKKMRVGR